MIKKRLVALYNLFANRAHCAHRLAMSACLAVFIAFSPFVGFHTVMVFLFGWLFSLHTPILLTLSMAINNPWTMVPIYGLDHWFGQQLCNFFYIDHALFAPLFLQSWNKWLFSFLGVTDFSLGAFLIGGNVLGVFFSFVTYPIVKYGIIRYIRFKEHKRQNQSYMYYIKTRLSSLCKNKVHVQKRYSHYNVNTHNYVGKHESNRAQ